MRLLSAPRQPFVGLVLAAGVGIIFADFGRLSEVAITVSAAVTVVCALLLLRWPTTSLTYLFVAWSFFFLHSVATGNTAGRRLASRLGDRPRAIAVTGAVTSEPKLAPNGFSSFLLKLDAIELEGKNESTNATVLVHWRGHPQFGDELRLFGMAAPLSPPRNPGEFDMRSYLARRDVRRGLFVRYEEDGVVVRHGIGNPVLRAAQNARGWMQAALCRGLDDSPDVQNFLSGIVLGLRHQTPEDIEEPFQQTGTLHLFAVAGLHVGIVAELLWMLAKVARLSRKWAAALIIPLLLFYSAVTGLHISSMRAAVMGALFLGGFLFERKVFTLNSLAAAAVFLLCWNTNELFSTGFQLSFSVVAAIVLLAEPLSRWFRRFSAPDPFLPRSLVSRSGRLLDSAWLWLGRGASVSMAAWIGSLLLLLWYFHLITPISLLANLAVVPIAFFILAFALLSLLTAPLLPWVSVVFNNANWLLAQFVLLIVHLFAQVPGGHYYLAHPSWSPGVIAKIDVLDLGAGASAHVRTGSGDWLMDCGSERDYERVLREYLHASGVNRLHGLLLTHGDSLHIGGAARLLSDLPSSLLIDNPAPDRSAVHRRLRRSFAAQGVALQSLVKGDSFELGPKVRAIILHPPPRFPGAIADDQAFVIQLHLSPSTRILFMSDSGVATENALLSAGVDLHSDVLVKGQHHSDESGLDGFLNAVRPRLIIATSRDFPAHERVRDDWAEHVKTNGIKLFRQDETGAVQMRFWRDSWEARAYVTGEIFRSSNR